MGQQQLLLIVLSVIIVGIAVVVGLTMFQTSAVDANRNAVIGDLTNLAAKAQQYYKKPTSLGGGGQNFNGFALSSTATGVSETQNDNGWYRISTTTQTTTVASSATIPAYAAISSSATTIYITGYGKEFGNDNTKLVQAYATVTGTTITTTIVN